MTGRLLNLREIADLAHVQRPVVSVWIQRFRTSANPFPGAQLSGSQKLYVEDDVVAWLERTGHGNNPNARLDVAAHSLWRQFPEERRREVGQALSALLVLRKLVGNSLIGYSDDDLLDLADQYDPDDEFLAAELTRVAGRTGLASVAESLIEAAWSIDRAHTQVHTEPLRTLWRALAEARLSPEGGRLVVVTAAALLADLGESCALMDPTGSAVDLLAGVAATTGAPVRLMRSRGALHRLTRRQLLLADVTVDRVDRGEGDWSVEGPALQLVMLPPGDYPDLSPADQLNLLEEIRLQMDERQAALVVGPAAVLTDPLADAGLVRARDELLRTGCVRAVVRLPAGLRPARPRERLALWLLAASGGDPLAERRIGVGDLSGRRLSPTLIEGLADDLLAARQGGEGARRRSWAVVSNLFTAEVIARRGSLVQARNAPSDEASRAGADWVVRLQAADASLGVLRGVDLTVGRGAVEELTIADAITRGFVRVIPGQRLQLDGLRHGAVPVISGHDLRVVAHADRLELHRQVDVRFTEPGDIVFTTHQGPRAIVDEHGGAVVLAPGRVLRLRRGARMVTDLIAPRISAGQGAQWRSWSLPRLAADQLPGVTAALAAIGAERAQLLERLAAVDRLQTDLIAAVTTRRITVRTIDKEKRHGATTG